MTSNNSDTTSINRSAQNADGARNKPCPICRKPADKESAPFCSPRCRDRDLSRWLNDGYAVPGEPVSPEAISALTGSEQED